MQNYILYVDKPNIFKFVIETKHKFNHNKPHCKIDLGHPIPDANRIIFCMSHGQI